MANQHKKMGTSSVGVQFKKVARMRSLEKIIVQGERGAQDPRACMI